MPETTILLNGFSVLDGANITPDPNGGNLGEGTVTISNGEMLFEPDDIIVMEVINAGPNGEVDSSSEITRIIVYDNAADYFNHVVMYTYEGNNPNQTGNIPSATNSVGDQYLRINTGPLRSSDPGAPDLGNLFIAPGIDLTDVANGSDLTLDQFQDIDYDQDTTIDEGTVEVADGVFHGGDDFNNSLVVLCFAKGTLIETPEGPRYIETLKEGDLVNTLDGDAEKVRWIGSHKMAGTGAGAPVRIKAGALGNIRDLWVSQNHRMLVRSPDTQFLFGESEVLTAAKFLVDDEEIAIVPRKDVEYYHILLDDHQIIFAEGCPAESLYPGPASRADDPDHAPDEIIPMIPPKYACDDNARLARYNLRRYEAELMACA